MSSQVFHCCTLKQLCVISGILLTLIRWPFIIPSIPKSLQSWLLLILIISLPLTGFTMCCFRCHFLFLKVAPHGLSCHTFLSGILLSQVFHCLTQLWLGILPCVPLPLTWIAPCCSRCPLPFILLSPHGLRCFTVHNLGSIFSFHVSHFYSLGGSESLPVLIATK